MLQEELKAAVFQLNKFLSAEVLVQLAQPRSLLTRLEFVLRFSADSRVAICTESSMETRVCYLLYGRLGDGKRPKEQ